MFLGKKSYINTIVVLFFLFFKSYAFAETFNENHDVKSGETYSWDSLNVGVKEGNEAQGTTLKLRSNTITILANSSHNNVHFDGACLTGDSCKGVILDMEGTNFNFSTSLRGDRVQVANRVFFNIKKGSNFAVPRITATDGKPTDFYLNVVNSNAIVNMIDFTNGLNGSGNIKELKISNDSLGEENVTTINGDGKSINGETYFVAIDLGKDGFLQLLELTNAIFNVRGDIRIGQGIGEVNLKNSTLLFEGSVLDKASKILLTEKSTFKAQKRSGAKNDPVLYMDGGGVGSYISVNDSQMDWSAGDIRYDTATGAVFFIDAMKESKVKIRDITYFDDRLSPTEERKRLEFKLQGREKSIIEINKIDLNGVWDHGGNPSSGPGDGSDAGWFQIDGDGTSTYKIDTFNISSNNILLRFFDNNITINNFNYGGDKLVLDGRSKEVKVGTLNLSQREDTTKEDANATSNPFEDASITLKNFNLSVENINIDAINFTFDATNSVGKLGNINFVDNQGKNVTFQGDRQNSFEANSVNINNGSSNLGTALISGINFKVINNFTYFGELKVTNSNFDVGKLAGKYSNISITNNANMTIGEGSNIDIAGSNIDIENGSSFNINGSYVLKDGKGTLNNKGVLNVNASNNFENINSEGTINFNAGNTVVDTVIAQGQESVINVYSGLHINNFSTDTNNIKTILNLHDRLSVDNLKIKDAEINFYIDNKTRYGTLYVNQTKSSSDGETENPLAENIFDNVAFNLRFTNTTIFKPGRYNRFTLITSNAKIPINEKALEESFKVLPDWLIADCRNPEAVTNDDLDGEGLVPICNEEQLDENGNGTGVFNVYTNIIRLTNYKKILENIPGYSEDEEAMNVAGSIDSIINKEDVTDNLVDIVNSLDFNSGCSNDTIGKGHNNKDTLTPENAPCILTLGENIKSLKAINNSVFLMSTHNNLMNAQEVFFDNNREYYGLGEQQVWVKSNINYGVLQTRNFVTGYNKFNNTLQTGITKNIGQNLNTTIGVGTLVGTMNGMDNRYDTIELATNIGLALSYNPKILSKTAYFGAGVFYGLNYYNNIRNIKVMDNQYSMNRDTKAKSNVVINEVFAKIATGFVLDYQIDSLKLLSDGNLFVNPNAYVVFGDIMGGDYKESGSSASLEVHGFNNVISEFSIGFDVYQEVLLDKFLRQEFAFWTPRVSLNLIKRNYGKVSTNYKFLQQKDDYMIYSNQSNYDSALIMQGKFSLDIVQEAVSINVAYKIEYAPNSFFDNSIMAIAKYAF